MEISWVETMVKQSSIRPEIRDRIYSDCQDLVKLATNPAGGDKLSPIARALGGTTASFGLALLGKALLDQNAALKDAKQISLNQESLAADAEFAGHEEKARARFEQVAEIAPTVAANHAMVKQVVKSRLHEGLTTEDVTNLAMVQAQGMPRAGAKTHKLYQAGREKQAAERTGELCADILVLSKTAGLFDKLIKKIKDPEHQYHHIAKALKATALVSSVPILAGIGTGVVHHQLASLNKQKLEEKLNESFEKAMRIPGDKMDGVREDKATARRSFETLTHFAPHVALEPSAASNFMVRLGTYGQEGIGIDVDSVKSLSEIERNLAQVSKDPGFMEGFRSGTETAGLNRIVAGSVGEAIKPTQQGLGAKLSPFDAPPKKGPGQGQGGGGS